MDIIDASNNLTIEQVRQMDPNTIIGVYNYLITSKYQGLKFDPQLYKLPRLKDIFEKLEMIVEDIESYTNGMQESQIPQYYYMSVKDVIDFFGIQLFLPDQAFISAEQANEQPLDESGEIYEYPTIGRSKILRRKRKIRKIN